MLRNFSQTGILCWLLFFEPIAKAQETSNYTQAYLQLGLMGAGAGAAHSISDEMAIYLHAGVFAPIVSDITHYGIGLKRNFGSSFYTRLGLGYAESHTKGDLVNSGPAAEMAIGNVWQLSNGLIFGAEWLGAGAYSKGNNKRHPVGAWVDLPQFRIGLSF